MFTLELPADSEIDAVPSKTTKLEIFFAAGTADKLSLVFVSVVYKTPSFSNK